MSANKEIFSDQPRLEGSNTTGGPQPMEAKTHKKPLEWLQDHEERICILEEGHDCKQEERLDQMEEKQEKDKEELVKRDESIKEAFDNNTEKLDEILEVVNGLDKQQALTNQHNGFQDKQIDGINEKEKESIRNRWVIIGLIAGAFVGPILIKLIEYYLFR